MDKVDLGRMLESVDVVLDKFGGVRVNGKVASLRTQECSKQIMYSACRRLHKLGYRLESVDGLRRKHIEALVKSWHTDGLSNKTMQNQFSRVKIFVKDWMGKKDLFDDRGIAGYLDGVDPQSLKVKSYTEESKSWSGNGVDVTEWLRKAKQIDERFWCMLLMGLAFGLRKKEMLSIKPWRADKGDSLDIDGSVAKNGRYRRIDIEGEYGLFQRSVLEVVKSKVKRSETLGWPGRTMKQNANRYYRYMAEIGATKYESGVTGHGLRAEFAENKAMLMGLLPPSLGGDKKQMTKSQRETITLDVSNQMGHGRVSVLGAYYGTFRKTPVVPGDIGDRCGTVLISTEGDGEFAGVYLNPGPKAGPDGEYRKLSDLERGETVVTIKIEGSGEQMGVMASGGAGHSRA